MALHRTKLELEAAQKELRRHAEAASEIMDKAAGDNRGRTDDENAEIAEHHEAMKVIQKNAEELNQQIAVEQEIQTLVNNGDVAKAVSQEQPQPLRMKSLGEQFTDSEGYGRAKAKGFGGEWRTGQIELESKALTGVYESGTIAGALIQPDAQAGILETLYQPLTIADLMASGTTTSNTVRYFEEVAGSITNAADSVSEGAAKPQSDLVFTAVDEPVQKIATFLPVSDEMLEDMAQIQSYVNQRLSLFVKITEEAQLLSGSGTAPDISGILDRSINSWARGTVDSNADAIFKAMNGNRGSAFLEQDAIVIHPTNWQAMRLARDGAGGTVGNYFGGGPFLGPYGGPQGPSSASQFTGDSVWGVRVHVTSAITAGTALVGSFRQGAQVFRRSGLSVEASNSHSDYFVKNLTAIRAEERLALAVYRPAAFCAVTGLS